MAVESAFEMTKELFVVIGKVLNKIPDYPQKKKEKYYKLLKQYQDEMSRTYEDRDDNLVGIYKMELDNFIKVFSTEIETNLKATWKSE